MSGFRGFSEIALEAQDLESMETIQLRPGDPGTAERWPDGALRALNCPESDPVTFALLNGSSEARFPQLRGWGAHRDSLDAGDPVLNLSPNRAAAILATP